LEVYSYSLLPPSYSPLISTFCLSLHASPSHSLSYYVSFSVCFHVTSFLCTSICDILDASFPLPFHTLTLSLSPPPLPLLHTHTHTHTSTNKHKPYTIDSLLVTLCSSAVSRTKSSVRLNTVCGCSCTTYLWSIRSQKRTHSPPRHHMVAQCRKQNMKKILEIFQRIQKSSLD
jgi:hypothetical protein